MRLDPTAENSCKVGPIHPHPDKYDFSGCDIVFDEAKSANQSVRGHNLCWSVSYRKYFWIYLKYFAVVLNKTLYRQHWMHTFLSREKLLVVVTWVLVTPIACDG